MSYRDAKDNFTLTALLCGAGLLGGVFLLAFHEIWDRDLFFHLAHGRALLEHGVPLRENLFVWAPSAHPFYQNPAWLFGVLLAVVYDVGGLTGVVALKCLLLLLLYLGLFRYLREKRVAPALAATLLFLVAMASSLRMNARPEIFTFLLFGLLVWRVERYRGGGSSALWWLPPLLALWANLHSGFIFGLIYLLLVLGGDALAVMTARRWPLFGGKEIDGRRLRRFGLLVGLAALATFVSPEPLGNYRFLFQHLHVTKVVPVAEYGFPAPGLVPWFYAWLGVTLLLLFRRPRSFPPATVLPALFYLLLAFSGVRFIPLCTIAALPLLAPRLADISGGAAGSPPGRRRLWRAVAVGVSALLVAVPLFFPPVPGRHEVSVNRTQTPLDAFRFLQANPVAGRLYNSMSFGAAGMFYLYPQYRLYQSSYIQVEEDRQAEAWQAAKDPGSWQAFLDRHRIDAALIDIKYEEPSPVYFPSREWAMVFFDDVAAVFLRRGAGNDAVIAANEYRVIHPALFLGGDEVEVDMSQYREGLDELERALRWSPDSFLVHLMLGYQYNAVSGQEAEALKHFTRAAELNPEAVAADFHRGLLLNELGRPAEAESVLKNYVRLVPGDHFGYLYLARAYLAQGDESSAVEVLRRGLGKAERKSDLHYLLGRLMRDRGDLDEALANLQLAAQLEPMNPTILNDLGVCLGMRGDLAEALGVFERALAIQPGSTEISANREYTLQQMRGLR